MNFLPIFIKMMELSLIIIAGYVANKAGVLTAPVKQGLTKVVLNVSLPATILASVMMAKELPELSKIGLLLVIAFGTYGVYFVIAKITSRLLRLKGARKGVVEFALIFSNVGFIGYPVTYAVFGQDSVFYTCVFNMPFNVLCYSLGLSLIKMGQEQQGEGSGEGKGDPAKALLKKAKELLLTPCMIASVLALGMALAGYQGPRFLGETCELLGGITTPGALLIIGSALAQMPFREMLSDKKAYIVTLVSVLVTPILVYFIFMPFVMGDALLLGEAVIISGMPAATAGTMLCVQYHGDEKFMAQITFLSTLLSIFTIPLLSMFLL